MLLENACNPTQVVAAETERRPIIHRLRADLLVEGNCQLVPVEDRPVYSPAIPIHCDSSKRAKQREAHSVLSRRRPDEEILQVNAAFAEPGGVVVKEQGEAHGLVAEPGQ